MDPALGRSVTEAPSRCALTLATSRSRRSTRSAEDPVARSLLQRSLGLIRITITVHAFALPACSLRDRTPPKDLGSSLGRRYRGAMRTLARLNVTPVKGLALHHPARTRITEAGLPENRRFYLVDEAGTLFSGSDFGPLVRIVPEYDPAEEHLRLAFPDGTVVEGDVSELGAAETSDFYDRIVPGHRVEGPWAEAFTSYIGKPVRMLRCDADGDGVDVLPLTVVSTASVRDLASKGGYDGELDSRRFRINLELDGCEPYDEDSWDGGTITIGEVALAGRTRYWSNTRSAMPGSRLESVQCIAACFAA